MACPEWTLEHVATAAAEHAFVGVGLRTFGHGASQMACDPALTDAGKVGTIFRRAGVTIAGLATGARLDAPVFPPVIGDLRIFNPHKALEESKHYVDLCRDLGAHSVRVFGFRFGPRERRPVATRRIADRLSRLCDHARNKDVFIHIENGGSFPHASDLADLVERVDSPLLRASYDVAVGAAVGDDPAEAVKLLGDRMAVLRLSDLRGDEPAPLGRGEVPCRAAVEAAARLDLDAWLVYTWPRLWMPELPGPADMLGGVSRLLYQWAALHGAAGDSAA
ncbi:MAG: sugar phosphate isomerase/epimerase [Phycisphaerales bacterium]|nr:sugar phosphate isomerase/epimerase [Phycisphaerales bacterium]